MRRLSPPRPRASSDSSPGGGPSGRPAAGEGGNGASPQSLRSLDERSVTSERARPRRQAPGRAWMWDLLGSRRASNAAPPRLHSVAGGAAVSASVVSEAREVMEGDLETGLRAAVRYSAPIPRASHGPCPVTSAATALHPAVCCCLLCRAAPQSRSSGGWDTAQAGQRTDCIRDRHRYPAPTDRPCPQIGPGEGTERNREKKGTNFPTLGNFNLKEKEVYVRSGRSGWAEVNLPVH